MVSPQLDTPVLSVVPVPPVPAAPVRRPARPVARVAPSCSEPLAGRGPQPVAPVTGRRDPVRPGARPARLDGLAAGRPVRGGCAVEARPVVRVRRRGVDRPPPAPLRLTARGRRVVAGLSMAIGLSVAAATVVTVELGRETGLQLAGSSTVVVRYGDTLWSIARDVAPDEDPRAVVDAIVELNGLYSVDLMPGAELQLP
ncbi:LysM peptidoglycan-binding domain-containing protein [Modestobacter sp. SSW1-42]|uniref:LysM peptidoglycan-binding domain-containing protein n=1 Tax=Modestobacter sp. SSW1-42 TaxID=596372 RepID=UPI0039879246